MDKEQVRKVHAEVVRFIGEVPSFRIAIEEKLRRKGNDLQIFGQICSESPVESSLIARRLHLRPDTVSREIKAISEEVEKISTDRGLPTIRIAAQLPKMRCGVVFHCGDYNFDQVMLWLPRARTELGTHDGQDRCGQEETIVVFDGCTYLRVVQVIMEDEQSREERRKYPLFFRNALEDFVFGAMLFDHLGVDENMWLPAQGSGYDKPVRTRLAELLQADIDAGKVVEVSSPVDINYLVGSEHRGRIIDDLDKLKDLKRHWGYWIAHVERDARYYMGKELCLRDNSLAYDEYEFVKPYLKYEDELRKRIPKKLFKDCRKRVKKIHPDFAERACEAFAYKVIVAHVVGGLNYVLTCDMITASSAYRDYLPSEGRSGLISNSWYPRHLKRVKGITSRVERLLLPYCVEKVVKAHPTPERFIETMLEIGDSDSSLVDTRMRLRQLRGEIDRQNYKAVQQLIEELGKAVTSREASLPAEQYFQSFDGVRRSIRWAQELVGDASSKAVYKEVGSMLSEIFPGTFGEQK